MSLRSVCLLSILGVLLPGVAWSQPPERAPWSVAASLARSGGQAPSRSTPNDKRLTVPLFGDQFQFGFNFQAGFNFQGGFQSGSNFQGGFQSGTSFQGGFQGGAPVAVARGSFKVGENGNPRPQDRVSISYNYYGNVLNRALEVHRETISVEKTFLDQKASVELRLPFIQNRASTGESESEIADPTLVLKYAFINRSDRVVSTGIAVTVPTSNIPTVIILRPDGVDEVHPTLLQPFVGYAGRINDFFVHGFSSIMVPTDSRDGTLLFNDVGVGYWLKEGDGRLRGVVPTLEIHINTPLTNRGFPGFADSVNVTAGSSFFLGDRLRLGAGVGRRAMGPQLFSYEALASLGWGF